MILKNQKKEILCIFFTKNFCSFSVTNKTRNLALGLICIPTIFLIKFSCLIIKKKKISLILFVLSKNYEKNISFFLNFKNKILKFFPKIKIKFIKKIYILKLVKYLIFFTKFNLLNKKKQEILISSILILQNYLNIKFKQKKDDFTYIKI